MQILWINIIMDGPPAQSLGYVADRCAHETAPATARARGRKPILSAPLEAPPLNGSA